MLTQPSRAVSGGSCDILGSSFRVVARIDVRSYSEVAAGFCPGGGALNKN